MIWSLDGRKGTHARRRPSFAAFGHREADPIRSTAKVHHTEGHERRDPNDSLDGLLDELELKFDLMRLRRLRAELEEEDERLASKEELLSSCLLDTDGPGTWRRRLSIRARLFWIGNKRGALADRQRWFRVLEGDLEFAMRLRGIRRRR
jgi:hypothetical protein